MKKIINVKRHLRKPYIRRDGKKVKGSVVNEHKRVIEELSKQAELEKKKAEIMKAKAEALRAKYLAEEQKAKALHQEELIRSLRSKSKEDRVRALKELRSRNDKYKPLYEVSSLVKKSLELEKTKAYERAVEKQAKARMIEKISKIGEKNRRGGKK